MKEATNQRPHWHFLPKWLRYTLIVALITAVVLFVANIVINRVIENKVAAQLRQFSPNISFSFSGVHANFLASSLAIEDAGILVKPTQGDTIHKPYIHFREISFSGFGFLKLIFSKEISISTLRLDKGDITLDRSFFDTMDSTRYDIKSPQDFKSIYIGHFLVSPANIWFKNDTGKTLLLDGHVFIDKINIGSNGKPTGSVLPFEGMGCSIHNFHYASAKIGQIIDMRKLKMDSRQGSLSIDSLSAVALNNDTAKNKQKTQPVKIETTIAGIQVSGLDFMKLADKKVIATAIVINESKTTIANKTLKENHGQPFDSIKSMMQQISIDTFRLNHASLVYTGALPTSVKNNKEKENDTDTSHISVKHFEIEEGRVMLHGHKEMKCDIDDLNVSNIDIIKNSFSVADIECHLSKLDYNIPGQYSKLFIDKFALSSKKQLLHISALKIIPQCTKLQLGERLGRQADYMESSIATINISGLDVKKLAAGKLIADKINMDGCKAYIFRDRRLPRLMQPQALPVGFLNQIPVDINVHSFVATGLSAAYEEFPKDGTQTGTLKIEQGQMQVSPLFNHAQTGHMDMTVKGSIMGSGTVEATIYMPTQDSNYFIKGTIKNLELTALQSSAENLGKFHIQSGILNNLYFEFTMNETKSSGKIIGEYHNLVIEKLKGNDKKVAWGPTFALKNIIIPKNKDASKPEKNRTGIIRYTRDNTRFVSFDLIKSLLSGIRDSFTFGFLLPK